MDVTGSGPTNDSPGRGGDLGNLFSGNGLKLRVRRGSSCVVLLEVKAQQVTAGNGNGDADIRLGRWGKGRGDIGPGRLSAVEKREGIDVHRDNEPLNVAELAANLLLPLSFDGLGLPAKSGQVCDQSGGFGTGGGLGRRGDDLGQILAIAGVNDVDVFGL